MAGFDFTVPRDVVIQWTRDRFNEGEEADERVEKQPWGFTVSTQSRAFLDTGDELTMLVGGGPYIVDGQSGEVWATSSSPVAYYGTDEAPGWSVLDDVETFERWRTHRSAGEANVFDVVDPTGAGGRLLQRHARSQGLLLPFTQEGAIGWSDMEVGYLVEPRGEEWVFRWWNRGTFRDEALFSHEDDARKMLLIQLVRRPYLGAYEPRDPLSDVESCEFDGHPALRWDGRDAVFLRRGDRERFLPFVRASLADIDASFSSPAGTPLIRYDALR
ncbi:YrhB domain-containing protein [Microbacterium aurantiacum]|uniref:YrhB family protein n=1 Tax=Microbacterium aurantiacum TaxID=162393 RepID=A0AAJ2LZL8_9MICO|nr:YrhB domain-containing protein [Microbacterium aurantiacum]MDS0245484.1 YrhB family protein [Microbacterium aurantiacum]